MTLLINIITGLVQLVVAIVFAVIALYAGFRIFARFTRKIDAHKEISRGNPAVGLFAASILLAISGIVFSGVQGVLAEAPGNILASVLELAFGLLLALGSIYLALLVFSRLNRPMDLVQELKSGNVAVAAVAAGMILAVSLVMHWGIAGIITAVF
jgi:uncharacterized membrane protein YjfL (UPF0719 family)